MKFYRTEILISIILSFTDHFFASGSEQDGMFVLGRVASLHVAQRRVGVHDASVTQVLEGHQVLGLPQPE